MVGAPLWDIYWTHGKWTSFVALLLAMVGDSYFRGCNWIPGLSSASSFDSDCSLITAIRFPSARIWMVFFVGANTRSFPQVIKTVRYNFGPISISNIQLMILGVSMFSFDGRSSIYYSKDKDEVMRAVSVDSDAAQLMGINVNRTNLYNCFGTQLLAGAGRRLDFRSAITTRVVSL